MGAADSSKFDDLLTQLGTGRWNLLYILTSSYWCLWVPPQFISGVYLAPSINYTCVPDLNDSVVSIAEDSCSYVRWSSGQLEEEEVACTEWEYDTSVFSSTLTSEFELVCERGYLQATYQSIYMLGTFISPFIAGYFADRFGRKVVVVVTQLVISALSILQCFLPNFSAILAVRFILGSVNLLTFYILTLEVCEPRYRATVGILTGLPWALGTIIWGAAAFFIRDWRWLQLAVALPTLLILPPLYVIDESPRWLIVRGHHQRALNTLHKAARWNKATLPPDTHLLAIMKDIQEESSVVQDPQHNRRNTGMRRFVPSLISTRAIALISVVVFLDYFAVSLVFDGFNMSGDNYSADPFLYLVLSGLVEVPGYTLTAPLIDRWGRRAAIVLSYLLCAALSLALAFTPTNVAWLVMTLALSGKLCISGAYQILYVYSSELFPTEVRLRGIGASSVFAQLASTILPYITSYLGPMVPWAPSVIFSGISLAAGLATLALSETRNRPLPDTILDLTPATRNDDDDEMEPVKTNTV